MRLAGIVLCCSAGLLALPAAAKVADGVRLPAGKLGNALTRLAVSRGVALLFDPAVVAHRRNAAVRSADDTETILKQLLEGTGLSVRKTPEGAYIVAAGASSSPTALQPAPIATPEILVVGMRTLDTDIRRRIDDIEPYKVFGGDDGVAKSQSQSLDSYVQNFVSANYNYSPTTQRPTSFSGEATAQFNLRGLGNNDTLVLVDGRRLPSTPDITSFLQPNVEGLPIEGIDRIEMLASTAGGIYGSGAIGGVVNIVTKRNYQGLNFSMVAGVTQRGDAPYGRMSADGGFTTSDGRTRVSFSLSYSNTRGLHLSDRNYASQALAKLYGAYALDSNAGTPVPPNSNSINILDERLNSKTRQRSPLILKPQYGGQSIGSDHSYLSLGSAGTSQQFVDLLSHAGSYDLGLSNDGFGSAQNLTANVKSIGGTLSLRHEFSDRVEVFFDALGWKTIGTATVPYALSRAVDLKANDPRNPFTDPVEITFPVKGLSGEVFSRDTTLRMTLGTIVRLPRSWSMEADFSYGLTTRTASNFAGDYNPYPTLNPFAGTTALQQQLDQVAAEPISYNHNADRLLDGQLRISGPLVNLPGGPSSLTLLAEGRSERTPGLEFDFHDPDPSRNSKTTYFGAHQKTYSLYAEARMPITPEDWQFWPLRGFELQGAVRQDWLHAIYVANIISSASGPDYGEPELYDISVHSFTVGARIRPVTGVMLRGSFATGSTPPSSQDLSNSLSLVGDVETVRGVDVERGNTAIPRSVRLEHIAGQLDPIQAKSASVGVVVSPSFVPGLRFSVDYTWLKKDHIFYQFDSSQASYILANPSLFPGAIVRAPLTTADQARGYTGGVLQRILLGPSSASSVWIRALDLAITYRRQTQIGLFGFSLDGTWQPVFRTRDYPDVASDNIAGVYNQMPKLKGNAEVHWSKGSWSAAMDAEFLGRLEISDENSAVITQSDYVPAQVYVDCLLARHLTLADHTSLDVHLGIKNLFDRSAPVYAADQTDTPGIPLGYALVADPRGRRFEVGGAVHF